MTPPLEMHHFQAVEHGGKIYVLGALSGRYPHEMPIPHVYIYDPATNCWEQGPEIPADRRRGAAGAVLHDGLIYLVGGIQDGHSSGHVPWLDTFNPRTGEWKRLPDAPRARDHFQAAVLDGKLYAAAGRRSSAVSGKTFQLTIPEVDVYDLATGRWQALAPMIEGRHGTQAVIHGGKIHIAAGSRVRGATEINSPEVYTPGR
jgi:N-acetylneuraminic acid mutarotase